MQDRRRFIRWQINRQAKVKLEGAEAFAETCIIDINFNGLQISLRPRLPKDTFLKLKIVLSDEVILDVEVWVVRHRTIGAFNVYGLYFTQIKDSDKEKIYKFVYKYFPREISRQCYRDLIKKEGGEPMKDRRVFERFAVNLPLRFLDFSKSQEGQAQTLDVSAKGIGLLTDTQLPPHTPLGIWLQVPDKGEPLYTQGEVVWAKPVRPGKWRVGVELEKPELMGISRIFREQ